MNESRAKNTIKNVGSGIVVQIFSKIITFVVRTVFIYVLNSEYLGVNGLFTNILSILSFAELGVGTAIIYNMYRPIAENDKDKINSLMSLYKKCYTTIGLVIFFIGLLIMPFIKYIIKDVPNIKENIYVVYTLFLINTSSSYFFSYKKSIISAHQKERIINIINCFFILFISIFQIVFLLLTKNYIVYLLVQIVFVLIENIYISKKANKMYPYLLEKSINDLDKKEKKKIFLNVKSLVIYKLGSTILSSTDNIIISSLINISSVGLCSNYVLIIESVRSLLTSAFNGATASIGNLNTVGETKKKENILNQYMLICFWIYSLCAILFIVLLNQFIEIWLGKNFVMPLLVPISLALSFWIVGMRSPIYIYRITMGLFERGKMTPFIASIINIVMSILLGKIMGVSGVFFATSIAQILSYSIIDPYIVYKYKFKLPIYPYVKKQFKYFMLFFISCVIMLFVLNFIVIENVYISLIVKFLVTLIILNVLFYIILRNTIEFKDTLKMVKEVILKKRRFL